MVCDALGFDEYNSVEFKKLKRLVKDMKDPTLSELQGEVHKVVLFNKASTIEGNTPLY
jgi:hypothetical protein